MKTKLALGLVTISAVLVYLFFQLGGLDNVELSLNHIDESYISGKYFEGKYNDGRLEDLYFEVKDKLDKGVAEGELVVVNYRLSTDSTEQGWVKQFIGVRLKSVNDTVEGFQMFTLPGGKIIRAKVSAHNLVMPKPDKIEELVQQMAIEQKAVLGGYTVEQYMSDRELHIDTPIIY